MIIVSFSIYSGLFFLSYDFHDMLLLGMLAFQGSPVLTIIAIHLLSL